MEATLDDRWKGAVRVALAAHPDPLADVQEVEQLARAFYRADAQNIRDLAHVMERLCGALEQQ